MSTNAPPQYSQTPQEQGGDWRNLPYSASMDQLRQWKQQQIERENQFRALSGSQYRYMEGDETAHGPGVPPLAQAGQDVQGLQQLANQLADRYGMGGRAPIVDSAGNFTREPNSADEAVKFQYIAQALANYKAEQLQKQAVATQQAGIGLVQSRGRGSLATLVSGQYQSLAQTYQADIGRVSQSVPDFSYYIQKEMMERQERYLAEVKRFQEKQQKYALYGMVIGGVVGFAGGGIAGAAQGAYVGSQVGQTAAYY